MSIAEDIRKLVNELEASRRHAKEISHEIEGLKKQQERVNHSIPLPRTGIDYAFAPHPPAGRLRSAGVSFVLRYLTGEGKAITRKEAVELSDHGLDIGVIFEEGARNAEGGYNAGLRDAGIAIHALDSLYPKGDPPIYFTVDFPANQEGKLETVSEYIRGAVHRVGFSRVGAYGDFAVVKHLHAENRCEFFWETYAWSNQQWFSHAQLRQVQNGIRLFGADCDLNKAVAADFGQFRV